MKIKKNLTHFLVGKLRSPHLFWERCAKKFFSDFEECLFWPLFCRVSRAEMGRQKGIHHRMLTLLKRALWVSHTSWIVEIFDYFKKGEIGICKFFLLLTRQKRDRKRKRREKSNWIFALTNKSSFLSHNTSRISKTFNCPPPHTEKRGNSKHSTLTQICQARRVYCFVTLFTFSNSPSHRKVREKNN